LQPGEEPATHEERPVSKSATAAGVGTDVDDLEPTSLDGPRPMSARTLGWLLVVLGAVGLVASGALAVERYLKLMNPDHVMSCSLNVFLDCGKAIDSWQGSLLGFPNPLLGVAAFPVVITTGVVVLAGARLPRWYWLSLLGATTVGIGLVVFLVWTSLYALVALCPYCMVVWAAMLPLFWYQVVHAVQEGHLPVGEGARRTIVGNRHLFLAIGYVALVAWVFLVMGSHLLASF
jgi:uncharacterized membrane protein